MTPYLIAGAALVSAAAGFWGGWAIKQGEWDASIVTAQTERGEALKAAAEAIAAREVRHATITQKVTHETVEVPVYRECSHTPSVLHDINAALSESADRGELPASDASQ